MGEGKENKKSWKAELLEYIKITVVSVLGVFLFVTFIAKPVRVDGSSMYPTLKDGEYGFSSLISTKIEDFKRFDVVVVKHQKTNKLWVKRIIGLPGDKVEFKDDRLYINDQYVKEAFLDSQFVQDYQEEYGTNFTKDFGPVKLKKDEYFVCGDNRPVSYDSRAVGPFKKDDIVSKYALIVYPFDEWKVVTDGK